MSFLNLFGNFAVDFFFKLKFINFAIDLGKGDFFSKKKAKDSEQEELNSSRERKISKYNLRIVESKFYRTENNSA